jgi:hypothetical protein
MDWLVGVIPRCPVANDVSAQVIFHPRGDVDVLWRTGRRSRLPLQSLADEHIYIPIWEDRLLEWKTLTGPSTDVEPEGVEFRSSGILVPRL